MKSKIDTASFFASGKWDKPIKSNRLKGLKRHEIDMHREHAQERGSRVTDYFCEAVQDYSFEQQMKQPPGYRPRGHGVFLAMDLDEMRKDGYSGLMGLLVSKMQMEHLRKRIDKIFSSGEKELMFFNEQHRRFFYSLRAGQYEGYMMAAPRFAGAVFLLSADVPLWEKAKSQITDNAIYFDQIRLGSVTLEQYILFHAAKDVYHNKKHIRLSEMSDRELIPDEVLKVIVNAFVIGRCGVEVTSWEV